MAPCAISLHYRGGAMTESPKLCRYCFQEINALATVCHHCSKLQTGFFKFLNSITVAEVLSFLISLGLLWFSVAQFNTANSQLVQASEANSKAESALKKATAIETQVLDARRDVLKVAECVMEIAQILPRTGGFGGGLGEPDKEILKKTQEKFGLFEKLTQ